MTMPSDSPLSVSYTHLDVYKRQLQVSEDEYNHFELATFLRIIRYIAAAFAMLFSGAYLAVTNFHTQVLPTNLILSFAEAKMCIRDSQGIER